MSRDVYKHYEESKDMFGNILKKPKIPLYLELLRDWYGDVT